MFLNFFIDVKNFIIDAFSNISFSNVLFLLTGILLGILIFGFVYLILLLKNVKNNERINEKTVLQVDDASIIAIIEDAKNEYKLLAKEHKSSERIVDIKNISWNLINLIAKTYYPKSEYPIYELTIDELMLLNHYITDRINLIFAGKMLRPVKKLKISQIVHILDVRKKIEQKKIVKAATKAKLPSVLRVASSVVNLINPAYWIKKFIINTTLSVGTNKLANVIIEIIGEETAKIYSRNVFNSVKETSEIEQTIRELEEKLEKDEL